QGTDQEQSDGPVAGLELHVSRRRAHDFTSPSPVVGSNPSDHNRTAGNQRPRARPGEIRAVRGSLGPRRAGFADFLGAGLNIVRLWELGRREPSALARRLLGAIRDDPAYSRERLMKMAGGPQSPPARRCSAGHRTSAGAGPDRREPAVV